MDRYLKIETNDPKEEVKLFANYFNHLVIMYDSEENSQAVVEKKQHFVIIKGVIDDKNREYSAILARWANNLGSQQYRKLTIWIVDSSDKNNPRIYRKMEWPKCFLLDYTESHARSDGSFVLKLKQKGDELEKITISCEALGFDAEKNGFVDSSKDNS